MSIAFGILMVTITGLIKRFDINNIDIIFWAGISFSVLIIIIIFNLFIKISNKTKLIGELE